MELIASLSKSFARPRGTSGQAPENLLELLDRLQSRRAVPEIPRYCKIWAAELRRLHQTHGLRLDNSRGRSRKIWTEQKLIYLDLISTLEEIGRRWGHSGLDRLVNDFAELLGEFEESLEAMEAWNRCDHPRCMACSWDGPELFCPHCKLQTLRPVRKNRPAGTSAELGPRQSEVFETIVSILHGDQDLNTLWEPLQDLQADFDDATSDLLEAVASCPEVSPLADLMSQALQGLEEIGQVFEDRDAQHLEDGWNRFYVSQLKLGDAIQPSDSQDQVRIDREQ